MLPTMSIDFYAKCKKCDTEEEFKFIGVDDRKFTCLRCGEDLENEKSVQNIIVTKS